MHNFTGRCRKCTRLRDPEDDCPCCANEILCGTCQEIRHAELMHEKKMIETIMECAEKQIKEQENG